MCQSWKRFYVKKKIRLVLILGLLFVCLGVLLVGGTAFYLRYTDFSVAIPIAKESKITELTKELDKANFRIEASPFEQNGVITASVSGSVVLFSSSKDLKAQIKALQLLIGRHKMEPVKPKEIDLRFEKIVVRY